MKFLLSIAATLLTTAALADIPRPKPAPKNPSASKLTVITNGRHQVKLVIPDCARPRPGKPVCSAMPSVQLDLSLNLIGCMDTAHVTYSIEENPQNSDLKVIVSALNIENPKSKSVKCAVAPTAVKSIFLGGPRMQSKNVSVEFLQNAAE